MAQPVQSDRHSDPSGGELPAPRGPSLNRSGFGPEGGAPLISSADGPR
jgi:hypothetical protein